MLWGTFVLSVMGHVRPILNHRRRRTCSVSHRNVTIWWPIYISHGFSAHPCEIARRFPRSVVKVGLNIRCKNISILSGVQPWTSTDLTLNCIRGGGFHGTQHLVFRLSHFNAAIFRADNFCNCLNSSCASFGEKKKKKIEVRRVVFALISIN